MLKVKRCAHNQNKAIFLNALSLNEIFIFCRLFRKPLPLFRAPSKYLFALMVLMGKRKNILSEINLVRICLLLFQGQQLIWVWSVDKANLTEQNFKLISKCQKEFKSGLLITYHLPFKIVIYLSTCHTIESGMSSSLVAFTENILIGLQFPEDKKNFERNSFIYWLLIVSSLHFRLYTTYWMHQL